MNNSVTSLQPIGTAVIVVHPQTGLVLLGERRNSYKAGWLGLPGGRVELGEKTTDTARRELREETSLVANELQFVGVVKENQGQYDFIHFIYLVPSWQGEPTVTEPDKCAGWQWLSADGDLERVLPGHHAAITLWRQQRPLIEI